MVGPLSSALVYHEFFRHSDMVGLTTPTAGFFWVVLDGTGEATGLAAEGLVVKAMRAHFAGTLPVQVSGNSPQQPTGGTPGVDNCTVPTGSPTYPLDVAAALSSDRKTFVLSVVNPTESAQEFALKITGVKLRGPGTLRQIAAPNVKAENAAGKKPEVELVEHPVQELGETVRVPAISINVYVFNAEA